MKKLLLLFALIPTFAVAGSKSYQVTGAADKPVHVDGYTKADGTYVAPYNRSAPNTAVNTQQQVTTPAPREAAQTASNPQAASNPQVGSEQTKIIAIYHGRGYFDPALAEQLRPALREKSGPTAGQNGAADKPVHVNGYTKTDGTSVAPYNRSAPNTAVNTAGQNGAR
jgi:hypothetical protein